MAVSKFNALPKDLDDLRKYQRLISQVVNGLMSGRSNNVLDVTLDANAATTNVVDSRIGVNTVAVCVPTTANASAIATPYRDFTNPLNGEMDIIHANDANTDKTFKVILVG